MSGNPEQFLNYISVLDSTANHISNNFLNDMYAGLQQHRRCRNPRCQNAIHQVTESRASLAMLPRNWFEGRSVLLNVQEECIASYEVCRKFQFFRYPVSTVVLACSQIKMKRKNHNQLIDNRWIVSDYCRRPDYLSRRGPPFPVHLGKLLVRPLP